MSSIPAPHFSAIEQYLFVDNRSSYPLDFFYRLKFDGVLDERHLADAFQAALKLHPLFRSIVSRRGRQYTWSTCESLPALSVLPVSCDTGVRHPSAIDLTKESGARLLVVPAEDKTTLLFQFHHATTDGLGAMGFVEDVLLAYSKVDTADVSLPMRDVQRLAERHWCGFPKVSLFQKVWKLLCGVYLSREFLNSVVAPVKTHQPQLDAPRTPSDSFRDIQCTLTVEETTVLKQVARTQNVSVNTLLLRDAFVALDAFRKTTEGYCATDYFRIAVPGNIRSTKSNDGMPAANFFSMIFPARRSSQIEDQSGLLESVHKEVSESRANCYFAAFIVILKALRIIPGVLERMVNAPKCQATMLLTNVGGTLLHFPSMNADGRVQLGAAQLQSVELVPPLRPYQSVAVALLEYAKQQTITLSYDPRIHTDTEAAEILTAYMDQLKSSLATAG